VIVSLLKNQQIAATAKASFRECSVRSREYASWLFHRSPSFIKILRRDRAAQRYFGPGSRVGMSLDDLVFRLRALGLSSGPGAYEARPPERLRPHRALAASASLRRASTDRRLRAARRPPSKTLSRLSSASICRRMRRASSSFLADITDGIGPLG